jgi:UDP-N-acetylglucosamine diphosphorylase/glucosamine-1-phosphate N-acetyltransferase
MNKSVVAVIMAGGVGKRMESSRPKVLHKVNGIPMINRIILTLNNLSYFVQLEKVIIVVGKHKEEIRASIEKQVNLPKIVYVTQDEPLGTGHAVMCCQSELARTPNSDVLVLSGDVPLLSARTMLRLICMKSDVKLITTRMDDPTGYGRIVTIDGNFDKIVEQKDCGPHQLHIHTVNCGIYCMKSELMCKYFKHLKNNNSQMEYYLTDLLEIIKREEGLCVEMLEMEANKRHEIMGVNTTEQLCELEKLIKKIDNEAIK